jgi:hypothetical protein
VFTIRLRPPAGTVVKSVQVSAGGVRVPVRRGQRLTARIDLRGVPRGTVVVRITFRTHDGRLITGTRTYRTCRTGEVPGEPPTL